MTKQMQYLRGIKAVLAHITRLYVYFSSSDFENIKQLPPITINGEQMYISQIHSINKQNGVFYVSYCDESGKPIEDSYRLVANQQSVEFMERLYTDVYDYCIGEMEMNSDEFINKL